MSFINKNNVDIDKINYIWYNNKKEGAIYYVLLQAYP